MKRIFILIMIFSTIFTSCSSKETPATQKTEEELRAEVKAEMEAESKEKAKDLNEEEHQEEAAKEKPKASEKNLYVKDSSRVFEFVSANYPEFTRENYDKWNTTYLDITGDGEDEVVFSSDYGDGGLEYAIILTVEKGKIREISNYIPLAKYGNQFEVKDGFLVHMAKSGGTGMQQESMILYYYNGHELVPGNDGILISEAVGSPSESYSIHSEIKGKLDDFVITYTKEDLLKETNEAIAKDKYTFDKDHYKIWHTPISVKNTAKSFDSVYKGGNLAETLEYYYNNLYFFGENERKTFSRKILDVINEDKNQFFNPHYAFLEGYESLYNKDTNEFDVTGLDEQNKEMVEKIQNRGIYSISKLFYTTEGAVDDYGFGVLINKWAFEILELAYNDVVEKNTPDDFEELKPFYVPQIFFDEWTSVEAVIKTDIVYPNVYVNSINDVYKLKGKETWKTNILLPVTLIDKKAGNEPKAKAEFSNKINFPTSEKVNGEDINYGEYFTVIVPMYHGIYEPGGGAAQQLQSKEYEISYNGKTKLQFAVFGELNLGGFTLMKEMGDEGTFHHIGETLKDSMVTVYCDLPTDFSSIKVTGSVYFNDENQSVEFTLDDMRENTDYKILKYK